jgi:hypothetical protein
MGDGKSKYAVGKDKIKMIDWGGGSKCKWWKKARKSKYEITTELFSQ